MVRRVDRLVKWMQHPVLPSCLDCLVASSDIINSMSIYEQNVSY